MIIEYLKHAVITAIETMPVGQQKNWIYRVTDAVYFYICPADPVFMFNVGYGDINDETFIAASLSATARSYGYYEFKAYRGGAVKEGANVRFELAETSANDGAWQDVADGLAKALSPEDYLILLGLAAEFRGPTAEPDAVQIDDLGGI